MPEWMSSEVSRDRFQRRNNVNVVGEAAGGQVSADVGADGLLTALRLDPRALRLGSRELAGQIVVAVRAAQRAHLDRMGESSEEPVALGEHEQTLARRLDELEVQASRDFDRLTSALDETLRRLEGR
ncbi:YbaB/EbfC family nucleoid-associated protein [Nonomuraea sp. NPDC026600]|uniref:YbaB/EbfC family nucleoid-associated protein n=1 Tax=Nonomuraea sp. NPDC026600 TaxID=3155363 RepID=UPI0033C2B98D